VLEISSGSGQHVAYFAERLPDLIWQPSDVDPQHLASTQSRVDELALSNLLPPRRIDVRDPDWGVGHVDAIFNANMIHIATWECGLALLAGAGRTLIDGGVLVLYGPFRIDGEHTSSSNAEFDANLKARDPRWGVRELEVVIEHAARERLQFETRVAMPANNQTLVFRKRVEKTDVSAT
jgi:SAM-dependent methyltransferase